MMTKVQIAEAAQAALNAASRQTNPADAAVRVHIADAWMRLLEISTTTGTQGDQ